MDQGTHFSFSSIKPAEFAKVDAASVRKQAPINCLGEFRRLDRPLWRIRIHEKADTRGRVISQVQEKKTNETEIY